MAKKKTEDVSPQQHLADMEASAFLGEEVINGKTADETPEEAVVEETPIVETPVIDEEAEKTSFVEEIAAKVSEKITPPKIEEPKIVEEEVAPWVKEERNPNSYEEMAEWTAHLLEVRQEKAASERAAQAAEQTRLAAEQEETTKAGYNTYIDEQLEELFSANKLPRENLKERENLFHTMYEVNQARVAAGKAPILSVKEIYYEHYKPLSTQPAGADAPISGGAAGSSPTQTEDDYSYNDIHRTSFFDFFRK